MQTIIFIRDDSGIYDGSVLTRLFCGRAAGSELGDVEQLRRGVACCRERIAKHGVAEGAGGADGGGAGCDEFVGAGVADAVAGFFAEEDQSAAGAAAEAALMRAGRFDDFASEGGDGAGFVVDVAIAAEVAGVVDRRSCRS